MIWFPKKSWRVVRFPFVQHLHQPKHVRAMARPSESSICRRPVTLAPPTVRSVTSSTRNVKLCRKCTRKVLTSKLSIAWRLQMETLNVLRRFCCIVKRPGKVCTTLRILMAQNIIPRLMKRILRIVLLKGWYLCQDFLLISCNIFLRYFSLPEILYLQSVDTHSSFQFELKFILNFTEDSTLFQVK